MLRVVASHWFIVMPPQHFSGGHDGGVIFTVPCDSPKEAWSRANGKLGTGYTPKYMRSLGFRAVKLDMVEVVPNEVETR